MIETKNAEIKSTMLGYEDHGVLTFSMILDYGDSCQGFGGHAFDEPIRIDGKFSHREPTKFGMVYLKEVMEIVGVLKYEDLIGKHIRVNSEHRKVHSIGNLLKEKWFTPDDLIKKVYGETAR